MQYRVDFIKDAPGLPNSIETDDPDSVIRGRYPNAEIVDNDSATPDSQVAYAYASKGSREADGPIVAFVYDLEMEAEIEAEQQARDDARPDRDYPL